MLPPTSCHTLILLCLKVLFKRRSVKIPCCVEVFQIPTRNLKVGAAWEPSESLCEPSTDLGAMRKRRVRMWERCGKV